MAPKSTPINERLFAKVEMTESCWLWKGTINRDGYGKITVKRGSYLGVHRLSYMLFKGDIGEGLTIDHLCGVKNCINPDHLEAVTAQTNWRRSPLHPYNRTHCPQNHEYTEENTYLTNCGKRQCRTCNRLRMARRALARKKGV